MTLAQLKTALDGTGLPVAYNAFPEDVTVSMPFIAYSVTGSNNFVADGKVYHRTDSVQIELYTENKEPDTELLVEYALDSSWLVWEKAEAYLDDERCFMITYQIQI